MKTSLRLELIRKVIHLSALSVPVLYYFVDRGFLLILILTGLFIAIVVEWQRRVESPFSQFFRRWLEPLLRESEYTSLTASTYMILGAFVTVLVFPKNVAIFCLFVLTVSDAVAALTGRSIGKHKLYHQKTWEGTLAFFLTAFCFARLTLDFSIPVVIFIAFITSSIELLIKNNLDNLILPIASGVGIVILDLLI